MSKPIAIGICVSPADASKVAPGFDYLELPLSATLVPLQDDIAFAQQEAALQALQPAVRAFNLFVPAQVKLVGESVDWESVAAYVEHALRRAARLGAEVIVFGSGGARQVPAGFPRDEAWDQLVRFLGICARRAAEHGIIIAIEPLNRRECNILNSYSEAVRLARDVEREEIRVLADLYHFMMDDEPLDDIAAEPDWLAHVHLADSGRLHPGSGSYPLERLFDILKDVGYHGRASIECGWGANYAAETAASLRFLRGLAS
jgi:sugar phosphate isomerase/epimerase